MWVGGVPKEFWEFTRISIIPISVHIILGFHLLNMLHVEIDVPHVAYCVVSVA